MKLGLSSVRQFSAALVALAIGILGCGNGPSGASPGDYVVPIAGDDAGPGGERCAVPALGCPCDAPDTTVGCGQVDRISNGYLSCSLGKRTCGADGSWGACVGDRIAMKKLPTGKQPLALQGAPTLCVGNPCDPYCNNFVDTPSGFDAGTNFQVVDSGVTLIGQGCTGSTVTPNPKTINVSAFDETSVLTDSVYQIISKLLATRCLNASSASSPTNVDIKTCTAYGNPSGAPPGATPTFKVIDVGGGVYNLKDTSSSTCLDVAGQGTSTGTQIDIRTCSNANQAQTFRLLAMGGGFYEIINTNSDLCLDVTGSSTTSGTLVKQQTCTGANNQLWQFKNNAAIAAFRTFTTDTGPVAYTLTPAPAGCLPGGSVAVWDIDQPDRVSIASTGNLTANLTVLSGIASTVNVSATVLGVKYTAVATINVAVSDTALAPAGEAAKYVSTSGIASKVRWLYPYDNTVFPLGLLAPVPQYQLSSGGAGTSIKVSLRYPTSGAATFSWSAVVAEPSPLRYTFPQNVWQAFEQSARGSSGLIVIQRYAGSLESESTRTVKFADGQMKGTVYYMSYNSGIGGSNSSNVSSGQVGAVLAIKPGALQPSVAIPSRKGQCNVCHMVSGDGTKLVLQEDDYHTGSVFDTATGNVSYTSPYIEASDCTAAAPCCVGAQPAAGVTCAAAGGSCQKCSYTGHYKESQSGYRFSFGALYPDGTFGLAGNDPIAIPGRTFSGNQDTGPIAANLVTGGAASSSTASTCSGGAGDNASKAFDNLTGSASKWCMPAPPSTSLATSTGLMYQFPSGTIINGYQIISADNNQAQDPKDWLFQGCAGTCTAGSDTGWVTLDTEAGEDFLSRTKTNPYSALNGVAYSQYRLRVTANAGDANVATGGTATASYAGTCSGTASDDVTKAFDNKMTANNYTRWCANTMPRTDFPRSIMYQFAAGVTVTRYTVTAAYPSYLQDPKDWTFQGCSTCTSGGCATPCTAGSDTGWTTLDTENGQYFALHFQTNSYSFANATAYRQYRLRPTISIGDGNRTPSTTMTASTASTCSGGASDNDDKAGDGLDAQGNFTKWCVPAPASTSKTTYTGLMMSQYPGGPVFIYGITSADNNPGQDPKDWMFQGCSTCTSGGCATPCTANSDTNWTTLDTQNGEWFPYRYQTITYEFINSTNYLQYRLRVTGTAGDQDQSTGGTATASTASTCAGGQDVTKAFDNLFAVTNITKWCTAVAPSSGTPIKTMYDFGAGVYKAITRYEITAADNNSTYDPKDWKFQGCSTCTSAGCATPCTASSDTNWVDLNTQTAQTFANRLQTNAYSFANATAYRQYRLRVTANNGAAGNFQIAELAIFTAAAPGSFQIADVRLYDYFGYFQIAELQMFTTASPGKMQLAELQMGVRTAPVFPVNPSTDVNGIAQAWTNVNGYPAITTATPAFSPGGNRVAFNLWTGATVNGVTPGAGKSIAAMDFDCNRPGSTPTCGARSLATPWNFSNMRELFRGGVASYGANAVNTTPYLLAGFSKFLPDNNAVLFQATTRKPCNSGCPDPNQVTGEGLLYSWIGAQGEIWMSNVTGSSAAPSSPVRLNNLNGTGYIPGSSGAPATPTATAEHVSGNTVTWTNYTCGATPDALSGTITEDQLNYAPTLAPKETAGYYWALFTSRRQYGNVATGKAWQYENCVLSAPSDPPTKKLWVSAINKSWTAGVDASSPAFYLPGQELLAGNTNAYWVESACLAAGSTGTVNICTTDDDCCGGTASPQTASCVVDVGTNPVTRHCQTIPVACRTVGVACTMTSQCCASTTCTGGVCLGAPTYTSQSFTRDYSSTCAAGTRVAWRFFDWEATETSDDHIDFYAQTWNTGFAPGALLLLGTASAPSNPASWTGVDVGAALNAAALPTGTNLRITFTFVPSADNQNAPVLVNWRQSYDCVPRE